jgi:hypothetical protein
LILQQPVKEDWRDDFEVYGLIVKSSAQYPGVFERAAVLKWRSDVVDLQAVKELFLTAERRSLILI